MLFFTYVYPLKFRISDINHIANREFIEIRLAELEYASNRILQRSEEWYSMRSNLLTASNIYKCFGSDSEKNQLIYEKCQPFNTEKNNYVNLESPMHWGQKYEPISVMFYEKEYKTKVGDFGCIQHEKYDFLGASPDGINILTNTHRFGRMLEIKNPISRKIDGIPSEAYWIQQQIQMEVCDLEGCDFLETCFKEIEENQFYDPYYRPPLPVLDQQKIQTGQRPNELFLSNT
jgi:putative phage-type endonuclease